MKFQLPLVFAGFCLLSFRVLGSPTIASLSSSQTVTEGATIALSVSANGTSPFSYQWHKDGAAISGATSSWFSFTPIRATDTGTYTVVVTDSVGSVTSGPVILVVNPAVAPSFSFQPSAATAFVGDTLNLYLYMNGTAPMTYVWKRGTTTVATTTTGSYSKANLQPSDAGSYTVTVTNIAGSVTSNAFTVSVNSLTAPTFGSDMSEVTVNYGGYISLYPWVSGPGALTYQWKKDGVAIPGATSSSFSKSNAEASDAGNYTLTATNSGGSTTSNPVKVTVRAPVAPTISSVSGPVSVVMGESFSLSVNANGTGPLSYQWKKDGVAISGATSSSFSRSAVLASDAGAYTAVVTNAQGAVTSDAITVAVANARAPVITTHPSSFASREGDYLYSVSVGVLGSGPLSYQWKKDGNPISGATGSSLYFGRDATSADAGTYSVVVSNAQGTATSDACHVTILPAPPPVVANQPPSQTLRQGQNLSLSASVTTTLDATYQWRKDGVPIPGATGSSYYKSNIASSEAGAYSFVATTSAGSVTSDDAVVTVIANDPPLIVGHPASASLLPGNSFSLNVEVRSILSSTVQWYRDGQMIPSANGTSYYISNAQPSIAGTYSAVVTNAAGSVTSRDAVITVDSPTTRPAIIYVQGSRVVAPGGSFSVNITTSGTGETVQWAKDGQSIPNAIGKTYSISTFGAGSAGVYTAEVTNGSGTFTSRPIVLEILDEGLAPLITRHPVAVKVSAGASFSFSLTAEGEAPLTYQWRKDGVSIPGATSSGYSLYNATLAHAGSYSALVTNANGSVASAAAALTVNAGITSAPVITLHPASRSVTAGSSTSLGVSVLDSAGVTYQWRKNDVAIAGATSSSLYLSAVGAANVGRYSVVVTNSAGSATSYEAVVSLLEVATVPGFASQPQSQTTYLGASVTFSATVTGSPSVSYQWRKNGVSVAGATSTVLTVSNVQGSDVGTYTLIATNAHGVASSTAATLTLAPRPLPIFSLQPSGGTVAFGANLTLAAKAQGVGLLTYQWRKNALPIAGATSDKFTITAARPADAGDYTVVATDANGSTESLVAQVIVTSSPFAGTYFGTFGNGESWALHVDAEGMGVFVGLLTARGQVVVQHDITISATGQFSFGHPAGTAAAGAGFATRLYSGVINGSIEGGNVAGQVVGASLSFSGKKIDAPANGAVPAGYFEAVPLVSDLGEISAIVAPDGSLLLAAIDAKGVRGGRGGVESSGAFVVTQPQYEYRGAFSADGAGWQGVYAPTGGTTVPFATPAGTASGERLINVATRGLAGSRDQTLIAGFVISGNAPKDVLIRAVGPGLARFNVPGLLLNPRLKLFRGNTIIMDNDDWSLGGFASQIADAAERLGAFSLTPGSADAALLTRLEPGAYTAQVSGEGTGLGVALVEVYDVVAPAAGAPKLINLSTRGEVGRDGDVLIVGIVVSGPAPKKLLVRGMGPSLVNLGVSGALADPKLQLFQGATLIRENDNWSDSVDATVIVAAAASVGAFSFAPEGKDAALLLHLPPGSYTAKVSGVANTTGVALVEAYEVP